MKKSLVTICAIALAGSTGWAFAEDPADGQATEIVESTNAAALDAIAADREGTIASIVSQWNNYEEDFQTELELASNQQLFDVQNATSFNEVRAVLQGRDVAITGDDLAGTTDLGHIAEDLTFTPVVPCRIFDTQFDADGAIFPTVGVPNHYYVHGSAALIGPQGGNPAGCPSPKGEPSAVAANFTVRNPQGNGNIRPYPFPNSPPTASFLNYQPGQNLANAGIVATGFLQGHDISVVHNFNTAHSLADVMGYFYIADQTPPDGGANTASVTADSTCTNVTSASLTVPEAAGYVTVTAVAETHVLKADAATEEIYLYLGTSPTDCSTFVNATEGYVRGRVWIPSTSANQWYVNNVYTQRRFSVPLTSTGPKTVTYYLNVTGTDNSAGDILRAFYSSIIATYSSRYP
jgi:hypothetical protein